MTEIRRTLSGWINHVSVDYISVEKVQNIGNCSMNMWQSRVDRNQTLHILICVTMFEAL